LLGVFANVPSIDLPRGNVVGQSFADLAAAAGLCKSKGEARRLVEKGGLYINNRRVEGLEAKVSLSDIVGGRVLVLRSGKRTFHLVKVS
jgi:tyrosyl-tRNA synthetase